LFSNLNIETKREEVQNQAVQASAPGKDSPNAKVNLVSFTIKMAYTPSKASSVDPTAPTTASAAPGQANPAQPAQVARN
jgi:hypothetical protein